MTECPTYSAPPPFWSLLFRTAIMQYISSLLSLLLLLLGIVLGQQAGTTTTEAHPALSSQTCTVSGCTTQSTSVVLDSNWRYLKKQEDEHVLGLYFLFNSIWFHFTNTNALFLGGFTMWEESRIATPEAAGTPLIALMVLHVVTFLLIHAHLHSPYLLFISFHFLSFHPN